MSDRILWLKEIILAILMGGFADFFKNLIIQVDRSLLSDQIDFRSVSITKTKRKN